MQIERFKKMKEFIELGKDELMLGFAASCVEGVARKTGSPYNEIVARMNRVGMIENFILPHYEELHTESRENLIDIVTDYLKAKEKEL